MYKRMHFTGVQAAGSLFRPRSICAAVAAAMIGLTGLHGATAAEFAAPPVKPVPAVGMATPRSPAPLRGVMRLNPSKFAAQASSKPAVNMANIQAACSAIDPNRYVQLLRTIQGKETLCTAASYSVEDQRAAGCTGDDTVDGCQKRLFNYCMDRSGDRAAFNNAATQEFKAVLRVRERIDAHIRYIEETIPLHSGEVNWADIFSNYDPHYNFTLPKHR